MSLVMKRYSVREFTDEIVTDDQVKTMLTSAMQAPSANNQQPWEFVVVTDKELLKEMSTVSRGAWMLENAPLCITVIMKETEKSPMMRQQDCGAAVENILLEAVNLGLGAVWIGVYPIEERYTKINKLLNIKEGTAFANIAIGHPKNKKEINVRYDESRVHYNKVK